MSFRLAVLISGSGTLLQSLLDEIAAGKLSAEIVAVISDRDKAFGLVRARKSNIPTHVCSLSEKYDRSEWDINLTQLVKSYSPELVVSAGFMKLLGPAFLASFQGRLINTHPALLPSFPGAHAVKDALEYGVKVTGCSVFYIDEGIDTGKIIAQEPVLVYPDDDEESLHERIKVVERRLLVKTVYELGKQLGADYE